MNPNDEFRIRWTFAGILCKKKYLMCRLKHKYHRLLIMFSMGIYGVYVLFGKNYFVFA